MAANYEADYLKHGLEETLKRQILECARGIWALPNMELIPFSAPGMTKYLLVSHDGPSDKSLSYKVQTSSDWKHDNLDALKAFLEAMQIQLDNHLLSNGIGQAPDGVIIRKIDARASEQQK